MFTGLIEEIGVIRTVRPMGGGLAFCIEAGRVLEGMKLGDSVAIDGACHTVTSIHLDTFEIESVATTLQRTTLGGFRPGRRVNLERAVAVGDRLAGHFVQGHVDAVAEVLAVETRTEHVLIDFALPDLVAETTILHGSIAFNGVSLTVNALPAPGVAQVSIIPHTWEVTALSDLRPGSPANLEGDLIGKYVRHLLLRSTHPDPVEGAKHV